MKRNLTKLLGVGFLCLSFYGFGQQKPITGRVVDSNGYPVQDAYVYVSGSNVGVYTDANGNYTIDAKKGDIIKVEFIGFDTKNIKVKDRNKYDVKLSNGKKSVDLDNLVAIGYGVANKKDLTGSVNVVSKEQLQSAPTQSLSKALQATTPGLQVANASGAAGADATIRVRGIGSLTASADPLWVVDGVVGAPAPNMEDVESVSVLKDAAATSVYGSRAANGVIVVTTKSGRSGKTQFNLQARYGISTNTLNKFKMLNSGDFYKVSWQGLFASAKANGATDAEAAKFANEKVEGLAGRNPYNVAQPFDEHGNLVKDAKLMLDQDWYKLAYRMGVTKQYDLNIGGGNKDTKFYMSIGYFDQKGSMVPDYYKRFNAQVNVQNRVNDKLKVGFRTTLRRTMSDGVSDITSGNSTGWAAFNFPNNVSLYELDDKFNVVKDEKGNPKYNWANKLSQDHNPIGLAALNKNYGNSTLVFSSANLNYEIIKDLVFDTNFSATYSASTSTFFQNKDHGDGVAVKGSSEKSSDESLRYISSSTLTYDKTLWDSHHLNALLGYEAEAYKGTSLSATQKGYQFNFSDELSVGTEPYQTSSSTSENRMVGMFSRLRYDYDRKYYASFSLRRDASAKFAPARRWGTFWSAAGSWHLEEENFIKNVNWLDKLRLRASYGTSGNAGIKAYMYMPLFTLGGNYNDLTGIVHTQLANPYLRWEKSAMTNVGVDFGIFKFLEGSVEWFKKGSIDLLLDKPLPYSTGWSKITENIGSVQNTGWEITLNSHNFNTQDFRWDTNFNVSFYKNKITSLTQDQIIKGNRVWKVGGDSYAWYMPEYAGVNHETGAAQWYMDVKDAQGNPTGKREITEDYNKATRYVLGSSLPDFYGGLTNTLSYKGFTLDVQLYFTVGGKIFDSLEQSTMNDGSVYGSQLNAKVLDAWRPDNKDSNIPQFVYNNNSKSNYPSSRFLYDGSYLRLRNVSLSYDLPKKYTDKIGISSLRAFVNIENLYTLTKYQGLDPEQGISGNNSFSTIPNQKTFTFGVKLGL